MPPSNPRVPVRKKTGILLGLAFFLGCIFSVVLFNVRLSRYFSNDPDGSAEPNRRGYTIHPVHGFKNIKPVLDVERNTESKRLAPLKEALEGVVDSLKKTGAVSEVSVFFRNLEDGRWTALNPDARYHPASLMKVALLLSYLKMAEATPGLLKQELVYDKPADVQITPQYYNGPTIEPGKKYTVHELLYYMIAHSDNHATWLLSRGFDPALLKKLFADFGLPEPSADELKFTMTAKECSVLFKAIYYSACLSPEYSEYAAELLRNCTFDQGFRKGFSKNTNLWHKFGEWRSVGSDHELHESGVVMIQGRPYCVTVMTRGKDTDRLAASIFQIARVVNDKVSAP